MNSKQFNDLVTFVRMKDLLVVSIVTPASIHQNITDRVYFSAELEIHNGVFLFYSFPTNWLINKSSEWFDQPLTDNYWEFCNGNGDSSCWLHGDEISVTKGKIEILTTTFIDPDIIALNFHILNHPSYIKIKSTTRTLNIASNVKEFRLGKEKELLKINDMINLTEKKNGFSVNASPLIVKPPQLDIISPSIISNVFEFSILSATSFSFGIISPYLLPILVKKVQKKSYLEKNPRISSRPVDTRIKNAKQLNKF